MKSILLYLYKSNTDVNINFCWESLCIFEKYNFKNDKRTTIWFGCTLVVYRSSETSTSQSDVIIRSDDRFLSLVVDSDSIVSKIYMLNFVLWLVFFSVSILTKILQFYPSWIFSPHTDKPLVILSKRTLDTQSIHIFGLVCYLSTSQNSPFYIRCYTYRKRSFVLF